MKHFLIFFVIIFNTPRLFGQVDIMRYFHPSSYFESLVSGYEKLEFKWTLPGKLQVEMNEGINALDEKNYEMAASHFANVLKDDSLFGPARYYRGVSYKLLRKFKKAMDDFRLVQKIMPDSPQALLEMGDIYLVTRDSYRATRFYQKANKMDPSSIVGQFKMGILSLYSGDRKKAVRYFESCNKLRPSFPDAYLALGVTKLLDPTTKPEAIAYFTKAIQQDSLFTMGYFWRGLALANEKKFSEAEKDWTHAIELNPANLLLFQIRGYLYMDLKNYDDAFSDFKKVILARSIDEDEAQFGDTPLDKKIGLQSFLSYLIRHGYGLPAKNFSDLKKGFCLLLVDHYKRSIETVNETQKPELSASAMYLKAITFQFWKKHDSAFACYMKTTQLDPDIFEVHKSLAIYQSELKDWKGAMFHINKMKQLQPRSEVTWRLSGLIKFGLKDYYGALIDLTHYLKHDSADLICLRNRAIVRYQIDDYKGSIEDFQKLGTLQPKDISIDLAIADNYSLLSENEKAVTWLQGALEKSVDKTTLKLSLADKLIDAHRVEEAKRQFHEVNKYLSSNWTFKEELALRDYLQCRIYLADGKTEKAFKGLTELILKYGEQDNFLLLRTEIYAARNEQELAKKDLVKLKARDYKPAKKMISKYGI